MANRAPRPDIWDGPNHDSTPTRSSRSWLLRIIRLAFGLLVFAALIAWLGQQPTSLLAHAHFSPQALALALAGTTAAALFTALRWKLISESVGGHHLRFSVYFHAIVVTRFLGQFTSTLGMDLIGRGVALRSGGSTQALGHATTVVILERIVDLLLPMSLVAWTALVLTYDVPSTASLGLLIVIFYSACIPLLAPCFQIGLSLYLRLLRRFNRPPTEPLSTTIDKRVAAQISGLSIMRFAAVVIQFTGIAWALGIDISILHMLMATPFAQLASIFGITPGALGFAEAGWVGGFRVIDLDESSIALFVLVQRLAILIFFGALSALSFPLRKNRRS